MPMPPASPAGDDAAHPVHPAPSASPPESEGALLRRLAALTIATRRADEATFNVQFAKEPGLDASDEAYIAWRKSRRTLAPLEAASKAAYRALSDFIIDNSAALAEAAADRVRPASDPSRPPATLREVLAWCERRGLSLDVPLFVFDDVEGNDVWARLDEAESGIDGLVFVQDGKNSNAGGGA